MDRGLLLTGILSTAGRGLQFPFTNCWTLRLIKISSDEESIMKIRLISSIHHMIPILARSCDTHGYLQAQVGVSCMSSSRNTETHFTRHQPHQFPFGLFALNPTCMHALCLGASECPQRHLVGTAQPLVPVSFVRERQGLQ